ncbi:MAG: hypothetical protein WCD45_01105 [Gallionella sp.]
MHFSFLSVYSAHTKIVITPIKDNIIAPQQNETNFIFVVRLTGKKKPAVLPQRVLIVPNSNWLGQQVIITSGLLRNFAA